MKLYCATTNKGKLKEFQLAAEQFGQGRFEIEPAPELHSLSPCKEDGATFEENAAKKALYYSTLAPGPLFADDSGLAVDVLNGNPGVMSARFAGSQATDEDNNRLLVEKMRDIKNRTARFICVVALAEREQLIGTFRGEVEGHLLDVPQGDNGFGYDPLFYYPPFGCTLAEVSANRKLSISHRGKALEAMLRFLDCSNAEKNNTLL